MRAAPVVELDLRPRRARLRGDDQSREGFSRGHGRAISTLARPEIVTEQISNDGTRKWLLRSGPGIEFETVFTARAGSRDLVRVEPGRLHAQLPASATRARKSWCAISRRAKSWASSWSHAMRWATGLRRGKTAASPMW